MKKNVVKIVLGCLVATVCGGQVQRVKAFGSYETNTTNAEEDDWEEKMRKLLGDIRNPYGFYYTTPMCEETDLYYGSGLGDTLYICIYPAENNTIYVSLQSLFGDDLYASDEHPA